MSIEQPLDPLHPLGCAVEQQYREGLRKLFPYQDCYALQRKYPRVADDLVADLDLYLTFIAGYSSSATGLAKRSREELRRAIPVLKKSFFDAYPRYLPLEPAVNSASTKELHAELQVADECRRNLVTIMDALIERA